MTFTNSRVLAGLIVAFAVGAAASGAIGRAHADPHAAVVTFDRSLAERLVRAQEAEVKAIEALTRATERCKR